jgi:cobyrinic acid a,c-diamide synthase
VILVIDCRGMTRGIAPLILGYQAFDPQVRIAGVILNRVGGKRHEAKLRAVIEHYTTVPVIGAVPEDARLAILERHLGLVPSNEAGDAAERIAELGAIIADNVDLERLLALTAGAGPAAVRVVGERTRRIPTRGARKAPAPPIRIGIARDRAFGFYYPDDLDAMVAAGAELVPFDTLRDTHLPAVDALFIGGGFPESFAAELSANVSLRSEIAAEIEAGLPVHAECGGLMYLTRSLSWQGQTHAMVGAIAADTVMRPKPVGRGYVILEATAEHPCLAEGSSVRAHEFHYSDLVNVDPGLRYAWRVKRGHGVDGRRDGIVRCNLLASYGHLRSVAGCDWAARFVDFARRVQCDAGAARSAMTA